MNSKKMFNLVKKIPSVLIHYSLRSGPSFNTTLYSFSTLTKPKLTNKEQYALTAYFAFLYIVNFKEEEYIKDPRSIRERLIDRNIFGNFILEQSRKYHNLTNLSSLGLNQQNMNHVLSKFTQKQYKPKQQEQRQAGKMMFKTFHYFYDHSQGNLFNPMLISGKIMSKILQGEDLMINGGRGIGKSFAFMLCVYLSNFIIECRLDKQSNNLKEEPFRSILKDSYYYRMRKMLYFTLQHSPQIIQSNLGFGLDKGISRNMEKDHQYQNLLFILNEYRRNGIETTILLDQSHQYYRRIRQFFKAKEMNWHTSLSMYSIVDFSKQLEMLKSTWTQLVVSNKDARTARLCQKAIRQNSLFDLHSVENPKIQIVSLEKSKVALSIPGQVQLYQYFWLRLQQSLKDSQTSLQSLKKIRLIFQELFCLPNTEGNFKNKNLIQWNRYVNLRNIGFDQEDKRLIEEIKQVYRDNKDQSKSKDYIKNILLKLKQGFQCYGSYRTKDADIFIRDCSTIFDQEVCIVINLSIDYAASKIKGQNRQKNHFKASLKNVQHMYFSSPREGYSVREHVNITAKQYPIGQYDTDSQIMTVFCSPSEFAKQVNYSKIELDRIKRLIKINKQLLDEYDRIGNLKDDIFDDRQRILNKVFRNNENTAVINENDE